MDHNLFKPKSLEEGKHAVVGDCNGIKMEDRWKVETPIFAKYICANIPQNGFVLDYGCGVGRLAKEVMEQRKDVYMTITDASGAMIDKAKEYIDDNITRLSSMSPDLLLEHPTRYDVIYCVYVLQHCPAIELRDVLRRIHKLLKPGGFFIYCSSDYRMAIRFDGQGFFDDRFLGVNLQEEISRHFTFVSELFPNEVYENDIMRAMIKGQGLPHPAMIYRPKEIKNGHYEDCKPGNVVPPKEIKIESKDESKQIDTAISEIKTNKLLLVNRLAPGDCLVMTNVIRDIYLSFDGKYKVGVRTPCNEIFANNPYITNHQYDDAEYQKLISYFQAQNPNIYDMKTRVAMLGDIAVIDMHYPDIHYSGGSGRHFCEGHRRYLEDLLGVKIRQNVITPEIYFSQTEKDWINPVTVEYGNIGPYWCINAGSKGDYSLKQYHRYQEVVDILKENGITCVQIGAKEHMHAPLNNVYDMRGKTNLRQLFKVIYESYGVITCVSLPMHISAAFKKPAVVVAGGREPRRWEEYGNHYYIARNGMLKCAPLDGCWKSKPKDCVDLLDNDIPRCHSMITPEEIANGVLMYYKGGIYDV